eukprot:3720400-Pyramimonas_sp.AAC.1
MPRGSGHPSCLPHQPRLGSARRSPLEMLTRNVSTRLKLSIFLILYFRRCLVATPASDVRVGYSLAPPLTSGAALALGRVSVS